MSGLLLFYVKEILNMNFNINIISYIRSWVNMNGLYMSHNNIYDVTEGGNTNFDVILQTDFVIEHSKDACVKLFNGAFVWSEMCKEPMSYAEMVINEVKKKLNKHAVTDDVECLYPRILTPIPAIDKVIFNDPATIVFWKDGTKTVVKAQDGEVYDDEKGLAMAISKKALGNQGNYYNTFDKYLIRPEEAEEE